MGFGVKNDFAMSTIRKMMPLLRTLDWETSLLQVNLGRHWRVALSAAIGGMTSVTILNELYPDTLGFERLWMGLVVGIGAGTVLGMIWQLSSRERRSLSSGWFLLAAIFTGGIFGAIAFFLIGPDLSAQENERTAIRSLGLTNLNAISIRVPGHNIQRVERKEALASFTDSSRRAELFYRSHELCNANFVITIYKKNGKSDTYQGCAPSQHPNDISLTFHAYFSSAEILVPDGKTWLDNYGMLNVP